MRGLNSKKGYTLIELIVTIAILMIVVVPLGGYFVVSSQNNQSARMQQEATLLAQSELEKWKQSGLVGDLAPEDVIVGNYVIRKRAVLENRETNTISATGVEPVAPTKPPESEAPLHVVQPPIGSAVENYEYPDELPSGIDATLHLYSDGIQFDAESVGTKDIGVFSQITLKVNNLEGVLNYGAGAKTTGLSQGHADALDLLIDVQTDIPSRELIALDTDILKDAHIYIYRASKPGGGYYSDSAFTANPVIDKLKIYHNLARAPQGSNANRLYRVSIEIFELKDTAKSKSLVKLDTMMHTK